MCLILVVLFWYLYFFFCFLSLSFSLSPCLKESKRCFSMLNCVAAFEFALVFGPYRSGTIPILLAADVRPSLSFLVVARPYSPRACLGKAADGIVIADV